MEFVLTLDTMSDLTPQLTDRVRSAAASGQPLALRGSGTKAFLGRDTAVD
jgi:hypothetical protein